MIGQAGNPVNKSCRNRSEFVHLLVVFSYQGIQQEMQILVSYGFGDILAAGMENDEILPAIVSRAGQGGRNQPLQENRVGLPLRRLNQTEVPASYQQFTGDSSPAPFQRPPV